MKTYSRRLIKIGGLALAGLAFTTFQPELPNSRISTGACGQGPGQRLYNGLDKSLIVHSWVRDNLVHVTNRSRFHQREYLALVPCLCGYMNAGRLQQVRVNYNVPLSNIPAGSKLLSEVTVPYPMHIS